ncbi:hypothetical protein DPMN_139287 [Dreissena polymorpha]|uniref:Uncharacterized protein n=1 Tax=Dreissena polymorpha TaxID=45954 RepID=A0A9D4JI04_DREPO|nr:hypothetical protein DPMN_139287 [Dreissena polymorpha]
MVGCPCGQPILKILVSIPGLDVFNKMGFLLVGKHRLRTGMYTLQLHSATQPVPQGCFRYPKLSGSCSKLSPCLSDVYIGSIHRSE